MGAENKNLSCDEVSLHNSTKDCWVIINAKAYDVTNFLGEHPGGKDVLLEAAGKDASEEFEKAGHGSAARLMLDEYYVGEIDQSTKPQLPGTTVYLPPNNEAKDDAGASSSLLVKLLQFVMIMGLAAGIHFYTKSTSKTVL